VRTGRARGIAAGLVVAGVVAVVVAGVAGLGRDGPAVVVADERGRQVASVPLPPRAGSPSSTSTRSTGPR
jgi:hypothetical protein